jgi:hypothetical protein
MVALKRNSLVLRAVPVACDVVTGLTRFGFNPANAETSLVLSYQRHLSTRVSRAGTDPCSRHERTALGGVGHDARRAGRPGSPAGVPDSRRPARTAGRAILSGWSSAAGAMAPPAAGCIDRLTVKRTAGAGTGFPHGYLQAFQRRAIPTGSLTSLPVPEWSGKRGKVAPAAFMPALRMPLAATRGK